MLFNLQTFILSNYLSFVLDNIMDLEYDFPTLRLDHFNIRFCINCPNDELKI